MNKLLNMLLRSSISASLSDREAFTDRIAKVIEERVGSDPDTARKISDNLAVAMDSLNDQMLIEQLLSPRNENSELEKKIDKLTEAIDRLNKNMEAKDGNN